MACNALYKFFAIIEIVLQLFTDCPFCCQCFCALSTFCSLLFALFLLCFVLSSHIIYVKALDICQPRQHLALIYLLLSHAAPPPVPTAVSTPAAAPLLPSFFGAKQIVSRQKQSHTAFAAEAQPLLCVYVCACALGATFNSARCVGAARREKIL